MTKKPETFSVLVSVRPGAFASQIITRIIGKGSSKDGHGDAWRNKTAMFHLMKGLAHLVLHMKEKYCFMEPGKENHLHLAMSRLALAACIEHRNK